MGAFQFEKLMEGITPSASAARSWDMATERPARHRRTRPRNTGTFGEQCAWLTLGLSSATALWPCTTALGRPTPYHGPRVRGHVQPSLPARAECGGLRPRGELTEAGCARAPLSATDRRASSSSGGAQEPHCGPIDQLVCSECAAWADHGAARVRSQRGHSATIKSLAEPLRAELSP